MKTSPILHTERLILRSFTPEDAAEVQRLINDPDMASTTGQLPKSKDLGLCEA